MFVQRYTPKIGDDLIAAIRDLLVLLRCSLGDLEALIGEDGVAGVGAATDLAAVETMTENLRHPLPNAKDNLAHVHIRWPRCLLLLRSGHYRTCIHRKAFCLKSLKELSWAWVFKETSLMELAR